MGAYMHEHAYAFKPAKINLQHSTCIRGASQSESERAVSLFGKDSECVVLAFSPQRGMFLHMSFADTKSLK